MERPQIATPGGRGPVDQALLIGSWLCRDLNPLPGQPHQPVATRYENDGTFRSVAEIAGRGPVGAIQVGQQGRWRVDGDRLVTSDIRTAARAADGNSETDAWARASAELVDRLSAGPPQASEVLRLDARELTLRPAGVSDPPVIGCIRQG